MTAADLVHGVQLAALAAAVFALAFALHVLVWRASAARPSGGVLIVLMSGAVLVQCLAAALVLAAPWPAIVVVGALALEIAACYVISYPALQANSPSLHIARELAAAGAAGISREELYHRLDEATLVSDRIDDLLKDGLAVQAGGNFVSTRRGAALARVFAFWKALLREPKGG